MKYLFQPTVSLVSDHVYKSALDNWTNCRPKNIVPYFTSFYSPKLSFYLRLRLLISSILSELIHVHSPVAAPQGLLKIFQSKENSHLKISIQYLGHHFKRIRFRTALGLLRLLKIIPNITVCSTWLYEFPLQCYQ